MSLNRLTQRALGALNRRDPLARFNLDPESRAYLDEVVEAYGLTESETVEMVESVVADQARGVDVNALLEREAAARGVTPDELLAQIDARLQRARERMEGRIA